MTQLNDLLKHIVQAIVDIPEQVEISEIEGSQATIIELKVAKSDLGKVIGKRGNNADAIRTILMAASGKTRRRITLEILE
jgi:uncharacterized protein